MESNLKNNDESESKQTDSVETPSPEVEEVSGASLAADSVAAMPGVSQSAIDAHTAGDKGESVDERMTDKYGRHFDPSIHESTPDGQGIKNFQGKLKMKRGGKKGKRSKFMSVPETGEPGISPYHVPALATVQLIYGLGFIYAGEDGKPIKILSKDGEKVIRDEFQEQVASWEEYYKYYEMDNVHPLLLVAATTGTYAVRVVMSEKGQEKTKNLFQMCLIRRC